MGPEYALLDPATADEANWELARARLPYRSIKLQRHGCPWQCPADEILLFRDGRAVYRGKEHVERPGTYRGTVDLHSYARLCYMLDRLEFMQLRPRYESHWTDLSAITLTVLRDLGGEKSVVDYGEAGPTELWAIQALIETLVERIEWKRDTTDAPAT